MNRKTRSGDAPPTRGGLLHRLRERGVIRVAASYAVIAWLLLQIADVTLEPLGVPKWVMTALIVAAAVGFPVAIALAWFLEIGEHGVALDTAAAGTSRPRTYGIRHYADGIVIGVLLLAVAILLVRQSDLGRPKPPENPAIAVLPFENLSGDPEQEYFSDGLAEEMLDRLGQVPGLRVIARSSSFGFKGKDIDVRKIAERLGVTTVLEGSVRRSGGRLKLAARLIDGTTGQQVWSGSFDRETSDIFAVQAELAGAIVNAIVPAARGGAAEDATPPTSDLDAYDLYLLARSQLAARTEYSIARSVDYARQAVEVDPNFARAHAQLAMSLGFHRLFASDATEEQRTAWLRQAESAVFRSLALDPDLSEAHDAHATLLRDTGRPGAEEEYKRAIELNPSNASAWHNYAVYLGNSRRPLESRRATERSLELDPRQPVTWANYLSYTLEPGGKRFREELARATRMIGDIPFALDRMTMPAAAVTGYPVEIRKAGLAKERKEADDNLPPWLNRFRAWSMVDLERAARNLPDRGETRYEMDFEIVRLFLAAEAAALMGEWQRLEPLYSALRAKRGEQDPLVRRVMAFWLAVQGHYDEAAESLAMAEPVPDHWELPMLGGDSDYGMMSPAQLRIYRASGRGQEATRLAREQLERRRAERDGKGKDCWWNGWVGDAALLANEGLKDEAVRALQTAMQCGDLPYQFQPSLPWFRSLEGLPAYDALLRERARRIEIARAELLRLESESTEPAAAR